MNTRLSFGLAFVLSAALASAAAAAPAAPAAVQPRLAPDVKPAPSYVAVTQKFVVANPTPIFTDIVVTAPHSGELDRVGEPVTVLANVPLWDWMLIGHDGTGIGYVPRSELKPAKS